MADFEKDLEECLDTLKSGGVILYPTDTVWGLGCDATNDAAVARIYELKKRPPQKSMIVLVADERQVLQYVSEVDLQVFDFLKNYGKAATVIFNGPIGLATSLASEDGTIAIRIVNEPFCKALIKRLRKPLVSTSANISGESTPAIFREVSLDVRSAVDYIVNYRQDDDTAASPSSVLRWNKDGTATILRP